jgi:hypothetical protein
MDAAHDPGVKQVPTRRLQMIVVSWATYRYDDFSFICGGGRSEETMKRLTRGPLSRFLQSGSTGRNSGLQLALLVAVGLVVFVGHARAGTTTPLFLDTFSDDLVGQTPNGPDVGSYTTMSPFGGNIVFDAAGGSYSLTNSGFTPGQEFEFKIGTEGLKQIWPSTNVRAVFVFPFPTLWRRLSEVSVTPFHRPRQRVVAGSRKVQIRCEAGSNPMLPV